MSDVLTGEDEDDIDIVELNEAFASQVLYCQRTLGIPNEKLNPSGGSTGAAHSAPEQAEVPPATAVTTTATPSATRFTRRRSRSWSTTGWRPATAR